MNRITLYIVFATLFFNLSKVQAGQENLRWRHLNVKSIYNSSSSVLLEKVSSFEKSRMLNTGITPGEAAIRKVFSGFEFTTKVAYERECYHEDFHKSRIIKRNRKAILSRKIFAPLIPFSVLSFNTFVRKFVLEGTTEYLRQFIFSPFKISVFVLISSLRN
ncbi:MAG: hypothetical protein KBB37_07295 [Bacteroidia bacterium]|nr:hypothetical protein [Bacteroidia bacterium]MBP9179018.1 hypothetical protein [Bacteroidia bacterium]MBP9725261.1 hypothetical protein [Bacteroidia bacterium]